MMPAVLQFLLCNIAGDMKTFIAAFIMFMGQ